MKAIKSDMNTSHIPVILLTDKDSIQDKEEGYNSGADSYLTKPFSAKLLRSRINNLLEIQKRLAKRFIANVPTTITEESNDLQTPSSTQPQLNKLELLNPLLLYAVPRERGVSLSIEIYS